MTTDRRIAGLSVRNWLIVLSMFISVFVNKISGQLATAAMYALLMPVIAFAVIDALGRGDFHRTAVGRVQLLAIAWVALTTMLNFRVDTDWVLEFWYLLFCWLFLALVPRQVSHHDMRDGLFCTGMVLVVGCAPLFLVAMASVFTGRVMRVPFFDNPVGIQSAGSIGDMLVIFLHHNTEGRIASFCILFSLYGILSRKNPVLRILLALDILLSALILAHSQSRTCHIGIGLALGLMLFRAVYLRLTGETGDRLSARMKLPAPAVRILAGGLAAIALFFVTLNGLELVFRADIAIARAMKADRIAEASSAQETVASRVETEGEFAMFNNGRDKIWLSALRYLKDHPRYILTGTGGTSGHSFSLVQKEQTSAARYTGFHNAYLAALVTGGLPLLALILAFLCLMLKPCVRVFLREESGDDSGLFIIPVFIAMQIVTAIPEQGIFLRAGYTNLVFYLLCGTVLHACWLEKNGASGAIREK